MGGSTRARRINTGVNCTGIRLSWQPNYTDTVTETYHSDPRSLHDQPRLAGSGSRSQSRRKNRPQGAPQKFGLRDDAVRA